MLGLRGRDGADGSGLEIGEVDDVVVVFGEILAATVANQAELPLLELLFRDVEFSPNPFLHTEREYKFSRFGRKLCMN